MGLLLRQYGAFIVKHLRVVWVDGDEIIVPPSYGSKHRVKRISVIVIVNWLRKRRTFTHVRLTPGATLPGMGGNVGSSD